MPHESTCACLSWVRPYGIGLPGEEHHRDCRHWCRRIEGEVYVTKRELIVLGNPEDASHDCDAMGCSSVSHVRFRVPLPSGVLGTSETQPKGGA